MRLLALCLVVPFAACGEGGADRHPAVPDSAASGKGGTRARGGASTEPGGAGTSDSAGAGAGAGGEGGGISYEEGTVPVETPGVCDPMLVLGDALEAGVLTDDATLLATTADELSLAFVSGTGVAAKLYVADRATVDVEFGTPTEVAIPAGYEVASGATLSGDGLELVLVKTDHSGFGALSRRKRTTAFAAAEPSTERFEMLNSQKAMSGRSLGWPVLTNDGNKLYFVSYFGQALVVESTSRNGVFDLGSEIDEFTLGGAEGEYKLLSGIASDERAIFYFDQGLGRSAALFRSRAGAPFYDPIDLGERYGVAPNLNCSRLYSSVDGVLTIAVAKK